MEAKELMLWDWVLLKSNGVVPDTNVQVDGIEEDGLFARDCDNFIGGDEVKPIPLTEEILKANGFGKSDKYMLWYFKHKDFPYYEIHIEDRLACSDFKLQHVHELQHALRLCGWEELADNFKVE